MRPRRRRPSRQELIDHKHLLEGEIRSLAAEIRVRRARGAPVADMEARLATRRNQHHQTRLRIDRTK